MQQERRVQMRVVADGEGLQRFLLTQPHVGAVERDGDRASFSFAGDDRALSELLQRAVVHGLLVVECVRIEADLEDIFLRTTRGNLQ
jgi:hypothetical protein